MNLIEQLGGYYQSKNWLDKNEIHVKHGYLEKYRLELLEHRRANNIFEVGDKVLFNGCAYTVIEINVDAGMLVIDDGAYGFSVYFSDVEFSS